MFPMSYYKQFEDICLILLSEIYLASMYGNNGAGQAWMKIVGIADQGGKRKMEGTG